MKADYGLDAPTVVRNLFVFSILGFGVTGLTFLIQKPIWFWIAFLYSASTALSLFVSALWMIYSSRVMKPKIVSKLIEELNLRKNDKVLDLGCGRGLLLIQVAKRVSPGHAYGIDLWQKKDQSGNEMDETLKNAAAEGVEVNVQTGDIRTLPFPDGMFDAVVSSLVIHNIPDAAGRERALSEMLRVLKPGGKFSLMDIHYGKKYAEFVKISASTRLKTNLAYCPPVCIIEGQKPTSAPLNKT